jgi:hypothetical protein
MQLKSRQQLKAFLLRQARRYPGKTSWTKSHERWIADQRFDQAADRSHWPNTSWPFTLPSSACSG